MPYKLQKAGDEWDVVNAETGESKGKSESRKAAVKHMRALYAAEGKKDYHPDMYYINEYIRYCNSLIETSQYIMQQPELEHEELGSLSESLMDSLSETLEQLVVWRNEWYGDTDMLKSLTKKIDDLGASIKALVVGKPQTQLTTVPEPITLTKDANGRTRVMMRVSNIFKDRHGEIITTEAHEQFVKWVGSDAARMPEFWLYHIKGSRWGKADAVMFDNGFLTASGLVDEGQEAVAEGLASYNKDLGVSHGFYGLSMQGKGYIDRYWSFEFSPLPKSKAANTWTTVQLMAREMNVLTKDQREFATTVGVPESIIEGWSTENKDFSELLKAAGVAYKSDDTTPTPATTEPSMSDVLTAIGSLKETVTALTSNVVALDEKQKAWEKEGKDLVANTLEAAVKAGQTVGQPASTSNDNVVSASVKQTIERDDWETKGFAELFVGKVN